MKHCFLLIASLILFVNSVSAEGTKEMCPNSTDMANLYLTTTNYTNFATYTAAPNYRLYIHIQNVGETILWGLQCSSNNVQYRLKDPNGNIVFTGTAPSNTNGQPGLISSHAQAVAGPFPLSGGYTPVSYQVTSPAALGDYYMEFNVTFGTVEFPLFDFTVVNGVNNPAQTTDVILGRVYSQAWQLFSTLSPTPKPFNGKFFVYSDDGIVTSLQFNQAVIGAFDVFCNQYGVTNTGNFNNDRKSTTTNTTTTFPGIAQYKVFFNNPDPTVYPDGVYGSMTATPQIIPDPNFPECSGRKFIVVTVNKAGTVDILIDVPYGTTTNDVHLYQSVVPGVNNIPWDGKDGLGVQVIDGTNISVTITYLNGLTNLPMWDVEQNKQGFTVSLIRPINTGSPLLVYWDDSGLAMPGCTYTTNLAGCIPSGSPPVPGCHDWGVGNTYCGDVRMINTWWYSASSSTATLNVYYTGYPNPPVPTNVSRCGPGTVDLSGTVGNDQTIDWYSAATGGTPILSGSFTFTTPVLAATTVYYAETRNVVSQCLSQTRTPITATVNPIPAAPAGTTPVWRCGDGPLTLNATSAGNAIYWFDVPTGGTSLFIGDNFTTPFLTTTTTYYAESQNTTTQCINPTRVPVVAEIRPIPQMTNTQLFYTICSEGTTDIQLTASIPGTSYTWTTTVLSGTVSGNTPGTGNTIAQALINTGITPAQVDYSVTPTNNSCSGNPLHFTVTVQPRPVPGITGALSSCLGESKVYQTEAGMINYLWSVTPGGTVTAGGTIADNSITVQWNTPGPQTVSVNYTNVHQCTAVNPTQYNVMVNTLPVPVISGSTAVCSGTTGVVYSTEAGKSQYQWNIPAGGTITAGGGTGDNTATVTWSTPGNQTITVNYTDANGCTATASTVYNVTVFALPVPALAGNASVCRNSTGNIYTTGAGHSNYVWNISPGGTVTAGGNATDNTATVTWNTTGAQWISVSYTDANGCQPVTATSYPVTVNDLPVPVIAGAVQACAGSTGNIYSTQAGMSNYLWTVSAGGSITSSGTMADPTITVTWNTPGSQSVGVNYTNGNSCTAAAPVSFPVTVHALPVPVIAGPAAMCLNTQGTYTTAAGMSGYTWTLPAGGSIISGNGTNTVMVDWTTTGTHTLYVNYTDGNGCTAPAPSSYTITVNTLPLPSLSGTTSICTGFSATYTTDLGMNNYTWSVSPGGTIQAGGGPGNNTVTVLWNTTGLQTVSVNYIVGTGCTAPNPTNLPVTVNPLPVPALAGPAVICAGTPGNVYTSDAGMTGYTWTVSPGGTITGGGTGTDNSVTVTWNTPGAQYVRVNYTNGNSCTAPGQTNYPVTVNPLPVPTIAGPAAICQNFTGTYTTESGRINYNWTVSSGGTVTAGAGTNSITVLWTTTGPQNISVNYFDANGCTAPTPTNYAVMVNTLPVPTITGNNDVCQTNTFTYTTEAGMTNYLWNVSAGGTIIAGGGTNNQNVTVMWNAPGVQTVTVNYTAGATGCTAPAATSFTINVKPKPAVSNPVVAFQQCSGLTTNIPLQSTVPGSTYAWTAAGSSGQVTGFSSDAGPVIAQTLTNSGFNIETVTYTVTPTASGCPGDPSVFTVTVYPVANVILNPASQSFCSGGITSVNISGNVSGTTYNWSATGSSANVTGYAGGSGTLISQLLTNAGTMIETVTYSVTGSANGCTGNMNQVVVSVNPLPQVTYTGCMIQITTTDAKPFQLKGGSPAGGTYSGTGVSAGVFNPAMAGPGVHTIAYAYSNTWGCNGSQTSPITVITAAPFACGNTLTDVRDGSAYPTVSIGTQCWMSANLNYGTNIPGGNMQRDNCVAEKYCFGDNPASCTAIGGMYQWDELMQYHITSEGQGLCPPAWHVPSENEWNTLFNFYTSNGFAGDPMKTTGFSGFNADFHGARFDNVRFDFSGFAVHYWSSSNHGPYKAWGHALNMYDPSVSVYPGNRSHAFFVRCIKD